MRSLLFIFLLCQQTKEPEVHNPNTNTFDQKDHKVKNRDITKDIYIYISDQKDFETEFVRETFDIPDDILIGKLKPKYCNYLELWLKERRNLDYQLIKDPTVVGPPLIGFGRFDRPKILAYPYKAVPHNVLFLKHIKYLYELYRNSTNKNIVHTQSISIEFKISKKPNNDLNIYRFSLCVDTVDFPVSPILGYSPYVHIDYNGNEFISFGPSIREQYHLLDCGTGFLTEEKK